MLRTIALSALVSLTTFGALPALAQEHRGGFEALPGLHELLKNASLTPAQQSQVQEIRQTARSQSKALWTEMRAVREQIADKVAGAGSVSASDIAGLQTQLAQLRTQLDQQRLKSAMQIRGVLTADQISHAAQVHEEMKGLRAQMQALRPVPSEAPINQQELEPAPVLR